MRGPILVLGKYEIIQPIASGGMATVYQARVAGPMGFEKPVAVKVLLDEAAEDEDIVRMFIDEARLGARLSHPNIASVLDFGEVSGRYFLAMEYVDGVSLATLRKRLARGKKQAPMEPDMALYITDQVLRGLSYAHTLRGEDGKALSLVHRDVSPQNILLDRSGAVKLCDFGIATGSYRTEKTRSGLVKGKAGYMSPEQAAAGRVDARSDQYSLGLTLVAMLSGAAPFVGKDTHEVRVRAEKGIERDRIDELDVNDALKDVLARALSLKPADRFKNADALSLAIEEAAAGNGEAGRRALAKVLQKVAREKEKAEGRKKAKKAGSDTARAKDLEPGSVKGLRNLLIAVGVIALLATVLALIGVGPGG